MTKDENRIKDWRSTGRRKGRRALYAARIPYSCVGYKSRAGIDHPCGKTTIEPPKDAPSWFDEIWPLEKRVLSSQLEADHKSKDYTNNELENVDWRCSSCHKKKDRQTEKGVAQETVHYW